MFVFLPENLWFGLSYVRCIKRSHLLVALARSDHLHYDGKTPVVSYCVQLFIYHSYIVYNSSYSQEHFILCSYSKFDRRNPILHYSCVCVCVCVCV